MVGDTIRIYQVQEVCQTDVRFLLQFDKTMKVEVPVLYLKNIVIV